MVHCNNSHRVVQEARCTDRNLVYGIECAKCNCAIDVGETETTLKERVSEHLCDIKKSVEKPINSQFKNHSEKDIQYVVLQTLGSNKSTSMRLLVEDIWIRKLKTSSPYGCETQRNRWWVWWRGNSDVALEHGRCCPESCDVTTTAHIRWTQQVQRWTLHSELWFCRFLDKDREVENLRNRVCFIEDDLVLLRIIKNRWFAVFTKNQQKIIYDRKFSIEISGVLKYMNLKKVVNFLFFLNVPESCLYPNLQYILRLLFTRVKALLHVYSIMLCLWGFFCNEKN